MTLRYGVARLAAGLWWGGLSAIGFVAVPQLFAHLPTPALAGSVAAQLFSAQSWLSIACAMVLLLALGQPREGAARPAPADLMLILGGLLLALLVEYGVAPRIVARQDLRLWHGVGTGLYALQWLCAGALLWRRREADRG